MMKILNKIILALIIVIAPISACDTDELVELNVNPNASSVIDWRFNMALAQLESCENRYVNWRANIIYSGMLVQHLGGAGYSAGYTQTDFPSHSASYFDYVYENSLKENGCYYSVHTTPKGKVNTKDLKLLIQLHENNDIKSIIDKTYSLDKIVEAHKYVDKGHKVGNVVINVHS